MAAHTPPNADTPREQRETTRRLLEEYGRTRDPDVRQRLILQNLGLVHYLANRFHPLGESYDDLVQVGTVGLIKAIDRFDVGRDLEFTTYAVPMVVGEIRRYLRDHIWAIRAPRPLRRMSATVRRAVEDLTHQLGRSPQIAEIAAAVGISEEEVLESMELDRAQKVLSLEAPIALNDASTTRLAEIVGGEDFNLERITERETLFRGLRALTKRERRIIFYRYYRHFTQVEVAQRLAISQMHVSRLERQALRKLREALRAG